MKSLIQSVSAASIGAAAVFAPFAHGFAQNPPQTNPVFTLGEIVVPADREQQPPTAVTVIDDAQMRLLDRRRLDQALDLAPGVHLNPGNRGGSRNESGFFLRGFDQSRVPILVDGIPVYVPYDGYLDLGRFLTSDLAEIEVAKGFASVLSGPGALGGAINLVTRRPTRALEGDLTVGVDLDSRGSYSATRSSLNLGSNQGRYYVQLGASYIDQDHYRPSDSFGSGLFQPPGERSRSSLSDLRVSGKVGVTPNAADEYVVGFTLGRGEKQAPPYAGGDATRATFFSWPYYDKTSIYLLTKTSLDVGEGTYVKTRIYYDEIKNSLFRYDDQNYRTQNRPFAFRSVFNDDTTGGSVELGTKPWQGNTLKIAGHVKSDVHREFGPTTPRSTMRDVTSSVAAETAQKLGSRFTVTLGGSYDQREAVLAQDPSSATRAPFAVKDQSALNVQGGVRVTLDKDNELFANLARKSRFATMFERYSYRLGNGVPNPGLKPERATNAELGWSTQLLPETKLTASVFFSDIDDYIQLVSVGRATTAPFGVLTQQQNIGQANFYGVELSSETRLFANSMVGLDYTHLIRRSVSTAAVSLYGTPRHKLTAYGRFDLGQNFTLVPSVLVQSGQKNADTGNGLPTPGRAIANVKVGYGLEEDLSVEVGVANLTDQNYYFDDGYPAAGRTFFASARWRF